MVGVTSNAPTTAPAPSPPEDAKQLPQWCRDFSEFVVKQLRLRPIANTAVASIYMFSPDGAVWEIKIDNAGALSSTKVKDA